MKPQDIPESAHEKRPTPAAAGDARQRLLALRLRRQAPGGAEDSIARRPGSAEIPLTFPQEALWFLDQLSGPGSAYNVTHAVRLTGKLDAGLLEQSLRALVERHESLRTTFAQRDDEPLQCVHDAAECAARLCLERIALEGTRAGDSERGLSDTLRAAAAEPFDLTRPPLVKAKLFSIGEDDHVLLLVIHHIVCDGWSRGILLKELGALYACNADHRTLPPLPVQFPDYACWERRRLTAEVLEARLSYWREKLRDLPALDLPTDRPRPVQGSQRGASERFALPRELAEQLRALAARNEATLFMVLLGAFQVLMMRHAQQKDLAVGVPIANRHRVELEGVVGFFVNTLVMRADLSGNPRFSEFLGRVRWNVLEAFAHQEMPFERLVAELSPQRDASRNPLYQVAFSLQSHPSGSLAFDGVEACALDVQALDSKFDLLLSFTEQGDALEGVLFYAADLFDAPTIQGIARQYRTLLEGIVTGPATGIESLPLLDRDDRERVLSAWNATARPYDAGACVHTLIERQSRVSPQAIAVTHDDRHLTYGELEARANRLARLLRGRGVRRGTLVGLATERGIEMVVAQLAILKAGAGYVPLDMYYPAQRIALMIEDAKLLLSVTDARNRDTLGAPPERCVVLDLDRDAIDAHPDDALPADALSDARPEDPAYVIYTSGSTGRPKGVVVQHRACVNFISSVVREPGISASDRVLAITTVSFDIAVLELLAALSAGAEIILAGRDEARDAQALRALAESSRANVMQATPLTWRMLVESGWRGTPRLKAITGGEPLSQELAARLLERAGEVWNGYGPTETTVYSTFWKVERPAEGISIGRPIANTTIRVLDDHGAPCPPGVPGELYIGGDGVALGYLHRPELTAERFIADPFSADAAARLYRTGDRGRWRYDGLLEHQGRLDFQVKIRGYRIETGEVEAHLAAHPQLAQAVVIAREDAAGDLGLVAYVVPSAAMPSTSELRAYLNTRLPDYMVPQYFVELATVPRLPNGKTDRKALPPPDTAAVCTQYVAPRSPLEEAIARVWREVLNVQRIGIHDNFFDLGGHSLLATRAVSRLRQALRCKLALRVLFESPTVEELAQRLEHAAPNVEEIASPARAASQSGTFPASFAQASLWFLNEVTGRSGLYNIPKALRVCGALDIAILQRCVRSVIERHGTLRTSIALREGVPVQEVHPFDEVASVLTIEPVEVAGDTGAARERALSALLQAAAAEPFDLSRVPLIRVNVFRTDEREHVVLLVVHHIVSDGWSMNLLARELGVLYEAFRAGERDPLPPLPMQFTDCAMAHGRDACSVQTDDDLAYWRAQLQGVCPLHLPTDRPYPVRRTWRGATRHVEISPALLGRLKALGRQENATLFMVLLAAFDVLLMRYSGEADVTVGSPIAGRSRTEMEALVGLFVNTLALRADLSGNPPFTELLRRVRQVCLDAYGHQDLPFDKLVAELSPTRDLGRNPLYQIAFALQNAPDAEPALGALRTESVRVHTGTAKFDLFLALTEEGSSLAGAFEYNTDVFDHSTIERMARHFARLLEGIAASPHEPLSRLPLIDDEERRRMLFAWNDTARACPFDRNLHQLFEDVVRATPDATAVILGEERLTYRELNRQANRLAHHLRSEGVGPDVLVGLCMERTPLMIVAVLAIVKAGGAYVPLDPEYPRERLAFMLADTAAPVVLTQQSLRAQVPDCAARILAIDEDAYMFAALPEDNPEPAAAATNLAYVMYTSGSTGTQKGVAVEQRAVTRLVVNTNYVHFDPRDAVAQASNISFDAATFEIWGALLNGAPLVVVPKHVLLSSRALAQCIEYQHVKTMFMTTSLFNEHAAQTPGIFRGLDQLLVGGERLDPVAVKRVMDAASPRRLINGYGPTETTTFATSFEVPPPFSSDAVSIPIGRPLANTRCYVLDAFMQPVPVGVIGELYVGGVGVARGYLHRPQLTAERFLDDPFVPGERLYRTGDLVRYLPDGVIDYVGRLDRQIKLRGFRVEPGEIEAHLARLPGVAQCVVVVREDAPGDRRLVGYVVPTAKTAAPSPDALTDALAQRLPAYLVPSRIVLVEAFPLTPNGKLDARALPAPDGRAADAKAVAREARLPTERHVDSASDARAPVDEWEQRLKSLWEQLLKVQDIGCEDNFFELGGHSLLAIRLLDAIDRQFGRTLDIAVFFHAPTIRDQALLLRQERAISSCVIAIRGGGERPPLFVVPGYGGAVSPFHGLAKALGSDQPLYLVDLNSVGCDPGQAVTLESVATQVVDSMRRVQPHGPYYVAGYSLGGRIAYEIAQQLVGAGETVDLLAMLDCGAPGYPRVQSFVSRTFLHIRHALQLTPGESGAYFAARLRSLRKYLRHERVYPPVFTANVAEKAMRAAREIQARAQVLYDAWLAYTPRRYPGSISIARATVRPTRLGVRDDDPHLGWGALVGNRIQLAHIDCDHMEILEPQNLPALAALLRGWLGAPAQASRAREEALSA